MKYKFLSRRKNYLFYQKNTKNTHFLINTYRWHYKRISLFRRKNFKENININPKQAEAWFYKGLTYREKYFANENQLQEEEKKEQILNYLKCFEEAIKINPKYDEAWYYRGLAHREMYFNFKNLKCKKEAKDIKEANNQLIRSLDCFEEALDINPRFDYAWFNKGLTYREKYFANENQLQEEEKKEQILNYLKCFEEAIKINPKYDEAWYYKGLANRELKNYKGALEAFEKAININPKYNEAWYDKGLTYREMYFNIKYLMYKKEAKDIKEANNQLICSLDCFEEAIKINPRFDYAWFYKGLDYIDFKEYEKAIDVFTQLLSHLNTAEEIYGNTLFNKGIALYNQKNYDKALEAFKEVPEGNPSFAGALNNIGLICYSKGEYEKALNKFEGNYSGRAFERLQFFLFSRKNCI